MQTGEAGDVLKKRNLRTLPGPLWIYHTGLKGSTVVAAGAVGFELNDKTFRL